MPRFEVYSQKRLMVIFKYEVLKKKKTPIKILTNEIPPKIDIGQSQLHIKFNRIEYNERDKNFGISNQNQDDDTIEYLEYSTSFEWPKQICKA